MGAYINPSNCTKEEFLTEKARRATLEELLDWDYEGNKEELPVVLVDNGFFTAAGIMYSDRERTEFLSPTDDRPKRFYIAKIEDLREVSDELDIYYP